AAAGRLARRRRGERDVRLATRDRDLDPAPGVAHRHVDDLLEAERADIEVKRAIGVGDADRDATDLGEIELGHSVPPLPSVVPSQTEQERQTHRRARGGYRATRTRRPRSGRRRWRTRTPRGGRTGTGR